MKIGLVNQSSVVPDSALPPVAEALTVQLRRDFHPHWFIKAQVVVEDASAPADWRIVLLDNSDQPGALGYHDFAADTPTAKVFAKTCQQAGESWSSVVSHELLELLVDPEGVLAALDYHSGRFYAYEVCDPVQGQSYNINGTEVSNFVYPGWYSHDSKAPYDHLGQLTKPFQLEADHRGYDSILDVSNTAGWKQITARSRWEAGDAD